MKQPKPSGCYLSTSNLMSLPASQTEISPAWPRPWLGSVTPLCSGSWGFPSPFGPEKCPSFQGHDGQFVNILLLLRDGRNQILQPPAQGNRRSALLSLRCGGCIFLGQHPSFVDQMYLELEQMPTTVPVTPLQLQQDWAPNPIGERQNRSHALNCPGLTLPGFKPSCLLLGLLCPCTRRTA